MTTSVSIDAQLQDAVDCLESIQRQIDGMVEDKTVRNKLLVPVSREAMRSYMRSLQEMFDRQLQKVREQALMMLKAAQDEIQRLTKHSLHRTQGRSGKGRTSTKKAAKSSSSSGGDGDGDGPSHARTKQKRRPSSNRNSPSKRPPNVPPGAIATTSSPQSPPPKPPQGSFLTAIFVIMLLIFVAYLIDKGERDMAWYILAPLSGALIAYVKPPDKKH